jgi:uncharacterized protein YaiI (UPF0178 family)
MRILVDADACPVKEEVVRLARPLGIEVVLVADTSHLLADGYSTVVTVDKGRDSADLVLANMAKRGDIVVTQDYGVAAMALARGAWALDQNGLIFDDGNIGGLLEKRHAAQRRRRGGGRLKGPPKRTVADDARFTDALFGMLREREGST